MNCMIIGLSRMLHQVGLIIDDKIRQALTPNEAQYFFISRSQAFRPIDDDDGNIGLIEDLLRPAYPFFSEAPTSSIPGVSMMTTGPRGRSSMAL